jgi:Outer membrane receptor for ferrienterochelin and colicins
MSRVWFALFSLAAAYGQSDLATVTGVVTDSAQAVMPAVTITIRNIDTNIARTLKTNEDGYFTITNLPPGIYELTAEREGFRTYRESGLELEVGETLRNDVQLSVGSVNDAINVTAEMATLNTENGAIKGDVILQAEIQDIPLNGRDFTDLAFLVPGVAPNAQGGAGSFGAINGARGDNNNFVVDGFNNRDPRGGGAAVRPNLDAMQEFKMEVSGYSAEYGKTAGAVLNMVLRSGTNRYHGSLFEFLRNDVFDARAFFDVSKIKLQQNQFGGTALGPLSVPKIYNGHDRTFFLLSWESFHNVAGQTRLGNVPTALERAGNFSQSVDRAGKRIQVKNPYAASALFPGDIIPASLFNPIGLSLMQYYPLPNRNNLHQNFLMTADTASDWDSFLGKIDHRFSSSNSMAFIYQIRLNRGLAPWAGGDLGTFGNRTASHVSLGGLDFTHMFSPTLLSEAHFGFSRSADSENNLGAGLDTATQLGIQGSTKVPALEGLPLITVLNFLPIGYAANQPVQYAVTDIQAGEKFTWSKGSNILKWGVDLGRMRFNQPFNNNSRGTIAISNPWTGDSIGDLLLGLPNSSTITAQTTRNYLRATDFGSFFNDDWKVTRSFTLNLGMRYEINAPPYDRYGRTGNFIPGINKIIIASDETLPNLNQMVARANLTGLVGLAKDYGLPKALVYQLQELRSTYGPCLAALQQQPHGGANRLWDFLFRQSAERYSPGPGDRFSIFREPAVFPGDVEPECVDAGEPVPAGAGEAGRHTDLYRHSTACPDGILAELPLFD